MRIKATREIISEEVKKTITEGDNAITLTAVKKETGVKITINRDGKVSPNEEVYALSSIETQSFAALLVVGYNQESFKKTFTNKLTTDNNGIAVFKNLPLSGKYKFVVFDKTAYNAVDVEVDRNSLKEATISIITEQPVKITIVKNSNSVNQKVYAIAASYWAMQNQSDDAIARLIENGTFDTGIDTAIKSSLLSFSATTDAQGVATFDNLKKGTKYLFVVATGTTSPKYKGVALTIDKTAQNKTIDITTPVRVTFNVTDTENILLNNVEIVINNITQKTDGGYAYFTLTPNTTYSYKATSACGSVKTGSFSVQGGAKTIFLDTFSPERGTIVLNNTSSNPYTITIGGSYQKVINGKSTIEVTNMLNVTYEVKWKQNSGYVFYPTEGSKTIQSTCSSKKVTISFP